MNTVWIILLVIFGLIICIGIIRTIFAPYKGFMNFLGELFLLDCAWGLIEWIVLKIGDLIDDNEW